MNAAVSGLLAPSASAAEPLSPPLRPLPGGAVGFHALAPTLPRFPIVGAEPISAGVHPGGETTFHYVGSELELMAAAANWKAYFSRVLSPFIGPRVVEVGAGIGNNIPFFRTAAVREWTCLEPDRSLAARIIERSARGELPPGCHVVVGTIDDLDPAARFETILYIDVLEHIADDRTELARAAERLVAAGHLVVLAPAHQFLFSPLDSAVGHFRRYDRKSLPALSPPGCRLRTCMMLDSAGFFASLANRLLLKAAVPSERQIAFWDKVLIPASRICDRLTGYRFGKTVIAVWRRES